MSVELSMSLSHLPISRQNPVRKPSMQMRAVLLIFSADAFLQKAVSPFIDLDTETIHWSQINKIPFGSGHRAAASWAFSLWTDEPRPKTNCFDAALSMSPNLQASVLQALALRWGLQS